MPILSVTLINGERFCAYIETHLTQMMIKSFHIFNEENKMNGKVKFFDETKGFGFVVSDDGKEYFVHQSGLKEGMRLNENDAVTFDVEEGDRGPKAVNVALDTGSSE